LHEFQFVARDESPDFHFTKSQPRRLLSMAKIERRSISHPSFSVEKDAHCPDLALLHGLLDANLLDCVIDCFSRSAIRRTMFKSPMWITPLPPSLTALGGRFAWLNSQWKLCLMGEPLGLDQRDASN
jgi:hypothetical protein